MLIWTARFPRERDLAVFLFVYFVGDEIIDKRKPMGLLLKPFLDKIWYIFILIMLIP